MNAHVVVTFLNSLLGALRSWDLRSSVSQQLGDEEAGSSCELPRQPFRLPRSARGRTADPRLSRQLGVALGQVSLNPQKLGHDWSGYFSDKGCAAPELRAPSTLITYLAQPVHNGAVVACASWMIGLGNSHGLAAIPPAVRRLGLLCR